MRKQTIIVTTGTIFILSLIFLLNHVMKLKPYVGSHLPAISFSDQFNQIQKVRNDCQKTIIIIFSAKCRFCRIQVNIFRKNSDFFAGCRLYFLSIDSVNQAGYDAELGPELASKDNFYLGTIDRTLVMRHFGAVKIPAMFFYDQLKGLIAVRYGLTRMQEMKSLLVTSRIIH